MTRFALFVAATTVLVVTAADAWFIWQAYR